MRHTFVRFIYYDIAFFVILCDELAIDRETQRFVEYSVPFFFLFWVFRKFSVERYVQRHCRFTRSDYARNKKIRLLQWLNCDRVKTIKRLLEIYNVTNFINF